MPRIGDLAPVLLSLGAVIHLRGPQGSREVAADDFFVDYRKTAMTPMEIMTAIFIPEMTVTTFANSYKVSKRKEMDISAVAAGFAIERDENGTVLDVKLAFGGMAATPKERFMRNRAFMGRN